MHAWRRGRGLVVLLERKQQKLHCDIEKLQNQIAQLTAFISQHYEEYAAINSEIKQLAPSGVLSKSDIYRGIRKQGALLNHQQRVMQKITQLEDEQADLKENLLQYRNALSLLDKRHHKLSHYQQEIRRNYLRRKAKISENDIQEMASHVRKNF